MLTKYLSKSVCHSVIVAVFILFASLPSLAYDAQISTSSDSVTFATSDANVKALSVKIVGPNGNEVYSNSGSKSLTWSLSDGSQNGVYKYELTLSNIVAGSRSRGQTLTVTPKVSKHSGVVYVQSGKFILPIDESEEQSSLLLNGVNSLALTLLDFIFTPAYADEVISDDLIVDGAVCVGNDCVNGESFGFDSVRLKENNLRLHFDDTSITGSFPRNDWRFLFNDRVNGGASFFSIEDATAGNRIFTVDAGAPANSLYVDSSGNIGFGTSTPSALLEMVVGNSPTIRLNQDASLGFNAQSWDVFGNEQGFFVRDVTGGSNLPLSIASGAPTNAVVVEASGNVGLGIDNPSEALHVVGNAIISGNLELGSSRSIKNQIKDLGLEQAMKAFKALEPVMFKYNHSPDKQSIGFIAEDVPELDGRRRARVSRH